MSRLVLFLVSLVSIGLLLSGSSQAAQDCALRQHRTRDHLERDLGRRGGYRPCELDARDRCSEQLFVHGCDESLCEPPPGVGADADGCFFEDAGVVTDVTNTLLDDLLDPTWPPDINEIWVNDVAPSVDPLPNPPTCGDDALFNGSVNLGSPVCLCPPGYSTCDKVTMHVCLKEVQGLKHLHFDALQVENITTLDLSTGSSRGPEASLITTASKASGYALADMCGLICPPLSTSDYFAAMTYAQVDELVLGVKDYNCDFEPAIVPVAGAEEIKRLAESAGKDMMIGILTPIIRNALNDLMRSVTPVPDMICDGGS